MKTYFIIGKRVPKSNNSKIIYTLAGPYISKEKAEKVKSIFDEKLGASYQTFHTVSIDN